MSSKQRAAGLGRKTLDDLLNLVRDFNRRRGWSDKHTPIQLALSVSVESAELLACFQWLRDADAAQRIREDATLREAVSEEMADVMIYLLCLCDLAGIDLQQAVEKKLQKNELRFPEQG
jgi:NTP pyrophosphatase (non-canonical NTP hydrolase)